MTLESRRYTADILSAAINLVGFLTAAGVAWLVLEWMVEHGR